MRRTQIKRPPYPLFGVDDRITVDSEVRLVAVPPSVGLYCRDMMAHRLGVTRAEFYVVMLIGGKLASVSGYMGRAWAINKMEGPFEIFGFSVRVPVYPRLNKLHMMMLTSQAFVELVHKRYPGVVWPIREFRTTCIAKGHELKENRGVLKLVSREKMDEGGFRLSYRQKYRPWDGTEALRLFLEKEHYDPATGEKFDGA